MSEKIDYLTEDKALNIQASANSDLNYCISYEVISQMSQGYRLNGGVIGFKHLWASDKTGVWDIKSPFVNNNIPQVPPGEYLYTTLGSHTFTVPTDVTSICVLVIS